jgi:hypothetical protein
VGIKTQREPDSQNATGKKQRVWFRFCNRYFHREKDEEGRDHDEALEPSELKLAIETARTEINRDGAHDTDGVQTSERIKITRQRENEDR